MRKRKKKKRATRSDVVNKTSRVLRSGWFNVLSKVRVCTPEQLLEMSHEQANPKNAVVSVHKTSSYQDVTCH